MDVPQLDIEPFNNGSEQARASVASELDRICRDIGFVVLRGHGVSEDTQRALYDDGLGFFDLPLERKLEIRRRHHERNRGYIPYGEERLVRMHGGDSPPDYKEVLAIGPCQVPDTPYYRCAAAYPNFAPNLWPERPASLRASMEAYYRAMERLSATVLQMAALSRSIAR